MTNRTPIVQVSGRIKQLPTADAISAKIVATTLFVAGSTPTSEGAIGMNASTGRALVFVNAVSTSVSTLDDAVGVFGDGSDGDVTLVATTTLTRDMFYNTLDVDNQILNTDGFRIFVKDRLTIGTSGKIQNLGDDASGATGGVAGTQGTLRSGIFGASGTNGAGVNGSNATNSFGGSGGDGGGGTGGTGGIATDPNAVFGSIRSLPQAVLGECRGFGGATFIQGGAGGASGQGNGGVNNGGGGGAGGGVVMIAANAITYGSAGSLISAKGGKGGNAVGTGLGGGGGGGGGAIIIVSRTTAGGGTRTVTGGSPGTPGAPTTGSTGNVFLISG